MFHRHPRTPELLRAFDESVHRNPSAEDALRDSQARLHAVLTAEVDPIIVFDEQGIIESVNPAFTRVFGYAPEEVVGENVSVLNAEPFRAERVQGLVSRLTPREPNIVGIGRRFAGRRKDGATIPVELSVSEMRLGNRRMFTGVMRDITEREAAASKLIEQESLAKLGELSAIVAHEVKNPLAGILGAARMLKRRLQEGTVESEICEEMIVRTDDLQRAVNDILAYSRPRTPRFQAVPVRILLEDTAAIVARDSQFEGVDLDLSDQEDILVSCDPEMLQPVLLNLFVNAAQAMCGRGKLRVSVEAGNPSCRITVHDSGPGIPHDTRQRIFEPFFTTKRGGTGLGLPIAKRAIELHGGTISVDCPPGDGTKVVVTIPTVTQEESA